MLRAGIRALFTPVLARCSCLQPQSLEPKGNIQYCKKIFIFLYILLLYLQALTFSEIKALKRRAVGCELGCACGPRLTLLRELGPLSAKRGPGACGLLGAAGSCPARVGSCPFSGPAGPFPGRSGGNGRVPARGCFLCPTDVPGSPV